MKRYLQVSAVIFTLFLILFFAAEGLGLSILTDPRPWLDQGGLVAATVGVALLVVDVLLPVPSSLVMIAHGALFGWFLGSALSLIGSLAAAWLGFFLGRRGGAWLARLVPAADRAAIDAFVARWGALAVVVSRPLPLLAETVAIMAGTTAMTWSRLTLASILGALPAAVLYGLTGATAAELDNGLLVFALVMVIAGGVWLIGRRVEL